jgi:hypothetical protein
MSEEAIRHGKTITKILTLKIKDYEEIITSIIFLVDFYFDRM